MQTQIRNSNVDRIQNRERHHSQALARSEPRLHKETSIESDLRAYCPAQHLDCRQSPWEGKTL